MVMEELAPAALNEQAPVVALPVAPAIAPSAIPISSPDSSRFYFIDAAKLLSFPGRTVPHLQQLLRYHRDMVVERVVTFNEVCAGSLVGEICVVSHRWMKLYEPDPDGTQLKKVKEHVSAHPEIKLVWFDAWCLAQGKNKTVDEDAEFKAMLREVNLLYLGGSVLILLELSYLSRFWVCARLWLAFQLPSPAL